MKSKEYFTHLPEVQEISNQTPKLILLHNQSRVQVQMIRRNYLQNRKQNHKQEHQTNKTISKISITKEEIKPFTMCEMRRKET